MMKILIIITLMISLSQAKVLETLVAAHVAETVAIGSLFYANKKLETRVTNAEQAIVTNQELDKAQTKALTKLWSKAK